MPKAQAVGVARKVVAAAVLAAGLALAGCGGREGSRGALTAQDKIAWGRSMYRPLCASCHGANGEGATAVALNRPELLQKYPTRAALVKRIAEGDPAAGMPACAQDLQPEQLEALAEYVTSLAR